MIKHSIQRDKIRVETSRVVMSNGTPCHAYKYTHKEVVYIFRSNYFLGKHYPGIDRTGDDLLKQSKKELKGVDYIFSKTAYAGKELKLQPDAVAIWVPK